MHNRTDAMRTVPSSLNIELMHPLPTREDGGRPHEGLVSLLHAARAKALGTNGDVMLAAFPFLQSKEARNALAAMIELATKNAFMPLIVVLNKHDDGADRETEERAWKSLAPDPAKNSLLVGAWCPPELGQWLAAGTIGPIIPFPFAAMLVSAERGEAELIRTSDRPRAIYEFRRDFINADLSRVHKFLPERDARKSAEA